MEVQSHGVSDWDDGWVYGGECLGVLSAGEGLVWDCGVDAVALDSDVAVCGDLVYLGGILHIIQRAKQMQGQTPVKTKVNHSTY